MKKKRVLVLLLLVALITSCNDDFVVNANWKDVTIVYALLNPHEADSMHFVRISRAFLNDGKDATVIAKIPDSLNYDDSLFVILQEWKNGFYQPGQDVVLSKIKNDKKDSGLFANVDQYLYATPANTILEQNAVYKLLITNTRTQKVISSETKIVGDIEPVFPRYGNKITINPKNDLDIKWLNGINASFYDVVIEIWYNEFPKNFPEDRVKKVIQWPVVKSYRPKNTTDKLEMVVSIPGINFYGMLKDNIPVNYNLNREFLRIDFIFLAGGEEIYNYINVHKPSIGTVQKKPEYTNINNGLGVFSSRNKNVVSVKITPTMLKEIQENEKTLNLNFIR